MHRQDLRSSTKIISVSKEKGKKRKKEKKKLCIFTLFNKQTVINSNRPSLAQRKTECNIPVGKYSLLFKKIVVLEMWLQRSEDHAEEIATRRSCNSGIVT